MGENKAEKRFREIPADLKRLEQYFKDRVGLGTSFDIGHRKLVILKSEIHIYYVNGLCDTQFIVELLKELVNLNEKENRPKACQKSLKTGLSTNLSNM